MPDSTPKSPPIGVSITMEDDDTVHLLSTKQAKHLFEQLEKLFGQRKVAPLAPPLAPYQPHAPYLAPTVPARPYEVTCGRTSHPKPHMKGKT